MYSTDHRLPLRYVYKEEQETLATPVIRLETKIGFTNHDYRICTHHHTILRESFMSERETKVASDVFCPPTTQFEKRVNNHEFIHDERMP